jgi:NitT/TauT family transport system substrate-binding protein
MSTSPRPRRRLAAGIAALALPATLLTACGGGDDSAEDGGLTELNIGQIPAFEAAAVYLGIEEGIFEEHGLDVTVNLAEGGAAVIPSVLSQENQIGYSNAVSELAAIDQGLPIRLVHSAYAQQETEEEDDYAVLVLPDSDIQGPEDLADANIAVNTLQNLGEVTIRLALEEHGVDTDSVTWTQLNYSDMYDALERGDVDAVWFVEPFRTHSLPGQVSGYYFTSEQFNAENPEVVQAFDDAITEAIDLAAENPDRVRQVAVDEFGFEEDSASRSNLPLFVNDDDLGALETIGEASVRYGIIDEEPDYASLFVERD